MINSILRLIRSLLLTTAFTFTAPLILIGSFLGGLILIGFLPGCNFFTDIVSREIIAFLSVFGSGYPLQGILTISLAFAFVGGLFDIYNFYRYEALRSQ